VVKSVSTKVEIKMEKDITELPPSEYLEKHFGIRLPPKVAEFWDRAGYVSSDGAIDFEDANAEGEIVAGYWELSAGRPFFDDELKKFLSWYLFDSDPDFHVYPCLAGMVCEVSDESGYFEFVVYDRTGNNVLFTGAVMGPASTKRRKGRGYVVFTPNYIVIEPVKK
jgi:hypothetical protein